MTEYYKYSVENGIYVAVRGIEDVWNMHFLEEAYPMYDRLIEDMVMFSNADPNRVYLLGFSSGGDDGGSFCGSQHVLRTSYPGYMRYRFLFTRLRKQSKWTILFKPKETREEHSSLVSFYGVKAAELL